MAGRRNEDGKERKPGDGWRHSANYGRRMAYVDGGWKIWNRRIRKSADVKNFPPKQEMDSHAQGMARA